MIQLISYILELIIKIFTVSWQAREEARVRKEKYEVSRAAFQVLVQGALASFPKELQEDNKAAKSIDEQMDDDETKTGK